MYIPLMWKTVKCEFRREIFKGTEKKVGNFHQIYIGLKIIVYNKVYQFLFDKYTYQFLLDKCQTTINQL